MGERARGRLVLEGGTRPRRIRPGKRSWTKAKAEAFCTALAETCNVKLAAEMAGVSTSAAYVRKQSDASFRAAWDAALGIGYSQLEMMMLERALHGVEKPVRVGGETRMMRQYSDRVGLALLRMHRDGAAIGHEDIDETEHAEACERIMARLQRLRDRDAESGATGSGEIEGGEIEVKGLDRIGLIRAGLKRRRR